MHHHSLETIKDPGGVDLEEALVFYNHILNLFTMF
jgi:hypothetical protein